MNKLELRYLFTHVRCKITLRLLLSRLKYTYYYHAHAFHWDISLHRSVLFHIPLSSLFLLFFCCYHLIKAQPRCYRSRWNGRIRSHLREWSKTYLRPRAAQNCILAVYSPNGISPRNSEVEGSALEEHTQVLAQATSALTSQCNHRRTTQPWYFLRPPKPEIPQKDDERKIPRASKERRERIAQMRLVGHR